MEGECECSSMEVTQRHPVRLGQTGPTKLSWRLEHHIEGAIVKHESRTPSLECKLLPYVFTELA